MEILAWDGLWSHQRLIRKSSITFKPPRMVGRTNFFKTVGLISLWSWGCTLDHSASRGFLQLLPHCPLHSSSHHMATYFLKAIDGDSGFKLSLKGFHLTSPGPPRVMAFLINLKPTDLGPYLYLQDPFTFQCDVT